MRRTEDVYKRQVKTPIAAARLVCDNNPGQASSTVSRELGRIDGYVEQALYYARSGSLDRDYVIRRVEVSALVHGAVRAHARSLIDQQVSVRTDGLDMMVFADAKWVAFVLGQLIENAAKYRAPREWGRDEALLCFAAVDVYKRQEYYKKCDQIRTGLTYVIQLIKAWYPKEAQAVL